MTSPADRPSTISRPPPRNAPTVTARRRARVRLPAASSVTNTNGPVRSAPTARVGTTSRSGCSSAKAMRTSAVIPDRMCEATWSSRTVAGNVVPVAVVVTPTSATTPSKRSPGAALKATVARAPSRIRPINVSATVNSTSGAPPDAKSTTGCPGATCSFASARMARITPGAGAVMRVYATCRSAISSRCAIASTRAAARSTADIAASSSASAPSLFSYWRRARRRSASALTALASACRSPASCPFIRSS